MSNEHSPVEFEALQRLLKLKRHEVPPPRYFNDFAAKVTDRLRGAEGHLTPVNLSWWQRWWEAIGANPAISASLVTTACGLVITGIFLAGQTPNRAPGLAQQQPAVVPGAGASLLVGGGAKVAPPAPASNSLFSLPVEFQTMPASGRPLPLAPR